jgi:hypothetical protein
VLPYVDAGEWSPLAGRDWKHRCNRSPPVGLKSAERNPWVLGKPCRKEYLYVGNTLGNSLIVNTITNVYLPQTIVVDYPGNWVSKCLASSAAFSLSRRGKRSWKKPSCGRCANGSCSSTSTKCSRISLSYTLHHPRTFQPGKCSITCRPSCPSHFLSGKPGRPNYR